MEHILPETGECLLELLAGGESVGLLMGILYLVTL